MASQAEFSRNPGSRYDDAPDVREELARLADENALLRAALAETRARLGDLEEAVDSDPLTGLANERAFRRELDRVVRQAQRHGTPAALLSIDLKALKRLNAERGRIAGDAALAHVARLVKGLIRTTDVAARLGGGFTLILDHLDPDSAIDTGERIARFIAGQPLDLGGAQVALEATVGVAAILAGDSAEDVLGRAERNIARMKEF
ncbi:GGDEF domain-containing protein [Sphingosinicella sp. LHD-64]|uniref:GGDEF domain-containing protein n=1 Tax=Sphingosinicella sp. LHD-64 TaxID=3072139 RepID=UPI00280E3089|nr:GGDEF domain-containing protein [Sphingosinicella sp. LHD-64]MDQ8756108.1 GGDEF domain-containing protein [Sphingosinicella sp. LHD-64]